jgi:hypothetical protein
MGALLVGGVVGSVIGVGEMIGEMNRSGGATETSR